MRRALDLAGLASGAGDVPVGALVLGPDGAVVGEGWNLREVEGDPTAHAEVVALRAAARRLGSWRLDDCTLVVTLEPCPMCAGAIVGARAERVVFGAPNPEAGSMGSLYHLGADPRLNHEVETIPGVRAVEAAALLTGFFAGKR